MIRAIKLQRDFPYWKMTWFIEILTWKSRLLNSLLKQLGEERDSN